MAHFLLRGSGDVALVCGNEHVQHIAEHIAAPRPDLEALESLLAGTTTGMKGEGLHERLAKGLVDEVELEKRAAIAALVSRQCTKSRVVTISLDEAYGSYLVPCPCRSS